MDSQLEKEKMAKIRQTIRKVILPLIVAIYKEDPTDVVTFCCRYYIELLQTTENNVSNADTRDTKFTGEISHKDKEGESIGNSDEVLENKGVSHSDLQGSTSEPLLTSNRSCKGTTCTVRETSSWNLPTNHPYLVGSRRAVLDCNLEDEMSRMGDQGCPEEVKIELENDAEAGDAIVIQKKKAFEKCRHVENEISSQAMHESTTTDVQSIHTLTSTPSYINLDHNFEKMSKDKEIQKLIDSIGKLKIGSKQLSPNSSYGFIPHLRDYYSEEESREVNSESLNELGDKCKTCEDIEELRKKLSDNLQSLAQEFRFAESNFNEEFQNAKEISHVIQGRHEAKEMNECLKITQGLEKDNEADSERTNTKENLESVEADLKQANGGKKNSLSIDSPVFKPKFMKSEENLKKSDDSKDENPFNLQEDKYSAGHGIVRDPSVLKSSDVPHWKAHHLGKGQSDSTLPPDQYTFDNCNSRQTIDESWKNRWYAAHPLLDSRSDDLQRGCFRVCNIVDRNQRNETSLRIGEAGDVPNIRSTFTVGDLEGCLGNSLQSSQAVASSSTAQEDGLYPRVSADEIRRRARPAGVTRNVSDKDFSLNIPSQSIPYSWRYMCKPRACSSEIKEKSLKRKMDEDNLDCESDVKKDLNFSIRASLEAGNVTEVAVVKEAEEEAVKPLSDDQKVGKDERSKIDEPSEDNIRSDESKNYGNESHDEIQAKHLCSEPDKPADSENKSRLVDSLQQEVVTLDRSADGRNEKTFKFQKITSNDNCTKEEVNHRTPTSDGNENSEESQRNESSEKVEPGSNSAVGDFEAPTINANNEQNDIHRAECNANIRDSSCENNGEPRANDPEEIIEVGTEAFQDSYESLSFSSFSESDKSSDYSEAEDIDLPTKM